MSPDCSLLAAVESASRMPGSAEARLVEVCRAFARFGAVGAAEGGAAEGGAAEEDAALRVVDWAVDALALSLGCPSEAAAPSRLLVRAALRGGRGRADGADPAVIARAAAWSIEAEHLRTAPRGEGAPEGAAPGVEPTDVPAGATPSEPASTPDGGPAPSSPTVSLPPADAPAAAGAPDPPIYGYMDYRVFLSEWLAHRAGRPSANGLARRIKMAPSYFSEVRSGKRDIGEFNAEALAGELGLDARGRAYFLDLVQYNQPGPGSRRAAALDRVVAARHVHGARQIVDHVWLVFRRWYVPAIAELTRCEGFREDPEWIAAAIRPPITAAQAAAGLDALFGAGVLERDEAGAIRPASPVFMTEHEVRRAEGVGLSAWHLSLLERAAGALDHVPSSERQFAAAAIPTSAAGVAALKGEIARFVEGLVGSLSAEEGPFDRVVQLSIQLFPLTAATTELPSPRGDEAPPTG